MQFCVWHPVSTWYRGDGHICELGARSGRCFRQVTGPNCITDHQWRGDCGQKWRSCSVELTQIALGTIASTIITVEFWSLHTEPSEYRTPPGSTVPVFVSCVTEIDSVMLMSPCLLLNYIIYFLNDNRFALLTCSWSCCSRVADNTKIIFTVLNYTVSSLK